MSAFDRVLAILSESDEEYCVGDKIETLVGGKWWPGVITGPLNKAGNYKVKFTANGRAQSYVSSPEQLRRPK